MALSSPGHDCRWKDRSISLNVPVKWEQVGSYFPWVSGSQSTEWSLEHLLSLQTHRSNQDLLWVTFSRILLVIVFWKAIIINLFLSVGRLKCRGRVIYPTRQWSKCENFHYSQAKFNTRKGHLSYCTNSPARTVFKPHSGASPWDTKNSQNQTDTWQVPHYSSTPSSSPTVHPTLTGTNYELISSHPFLSSCPLSSEFSAKHPLICWAPTFALLMSSFLKKTKLNQPS